MTAPQLSMTQRDVRLADGSFKYEVVAQIVSRGSLPFAELFVVSILDPTNPKSDVLARLATPHDLRSESDVLYIRVDSSDMTSISGDPYGRVANIDELTELPRDRVQAVRTGKVEYLTSVVAILYDNLTTAIAASKTIRARLSKLVTDYTTFFGTFATSTPVIYALPLPDPSVETEKTDVYKARKSERVAAEARLVDARAAQAACAAGDLIIQTKIDILAADIAFLEAARNRVVNLTETGTVVGGTCTVAPTATATTNVKDFVLNGSDPLSYQTLLNQKRTDFTSFRTELAQRDAQCAAFATAVAQAEAEILAARRQEDAALRDVFSVCPTFNPETVTT